MQLVINVICRLEQIVDLTAAVVVTFSKTSCVRRLKKDPTGSSDD